MEFLKRYFLQKSTMGKEVIRNEKKKQIKKKKEKAIMKRFENP